MYRDAGSQVTTRWEYMFQDLSLGDADDEGVTAHLNRCGAEGWEVVACSTSALNSVMFVLKRQLP